LIEELGTIPAAIRRNKRTQSTLRIRQEIMHSFGESQSQAFEREKTAKPEQRNPQAKPAATRTNATKAEVTVPISNDDEGGAEPALVVEALGAAELLALPVEVETAEPLTEVGLAPTPV
jgi:hypothetical protein